MNFLFILRKLLLKVLIKAVELFKIRAVLKIQHYNSKKMIKNQPKWANMYAQKG